MDSVAECSAANDNASSDLLAKLQHVHSCSIFPLYHTPNVESSHNQKYYSALAVEEELAHYGLLNMYMQSFRQQDFLHNEVY